MRARIKGIISLVILLTIAFASGFGLSSMRRPEGTTQIVEQRYELDEWELLTLAIIKTESNFNASAVGKKQDVGCMQITPVYVKEANRILGEERYTHTDAFDIQKSIDMFNTVQDRRNPEHDIEKAIELHNPGGDTIGYARRVLENYRYLSQIESIRLIITDYGKEK